MILILFNILGVAESNKTHTSVVNSALNILEIVCSTYR